MSPDTGVNVNDWPAPELHAVWVSCAALLPLGTVAQFPLAWLMIVLVNVVAALAGAAATNPPVSKATGRRMNRLIGISESGQEAAVGTVQDPVLLGLVEVGVRVV